MIQVASSSKKNTEHGIDLDRFSDILRKNKGELMKWLKNIFTNKGESRPDSPEAVIDRCKKEIEKLEDVQARADTVPTPPSCCDCKCQEEAPVEQAVPFAWYSRFVKSVKQIAKKKGEKAPAYANRMKKVQEKLIKDLELVKVGVPAPKPEIIIKEVTVNSKKPVQDKAILQVMKNLLEANSGEMKGAINVYSDGKWETRKVNRSEALDLIARAEKGDIIIS
jgi:hypothetical protein